MRLNEEKFVIIGGTGNHRLFKEIIAWINSTINANLRFIHIDYVNFSDGEPGFKYGDHKKLEGKIAIIFQTVTNFKLENQLMTLCWSAKHQYGAKKVIVVLPFMSYRRQDAHANKPYEIDRNQQFVYLLKCNGADEVILCDIHSETTLKNCETHGIKAHNVDGAPVFAERLQAIVDLQRENGKKVFTFSPDAGSANRVLELSKLLSLPMLINMKNRDHAGNISLYKDEKLLDVLRKKYNYDISFAEPELVKDGVLILRDDEIASGKTLFENAWFLKNLGASYVISCVTHAVCNAGWKSYFFKNPFYLFLLGNTIELPYEERDKKNVTDVNFASIIGAQLMKLMFQSQKENK